MADRKGVPAKSIETDPHLMPEVKVTETKSLFSSETRSNVSQKLLMRAAELADKKKKEREAHPDRMKYFLPRVYEYWEDDTAIDEEIKEQEKLMREIQLKEKFLKAKKDAGTFDSDDEEAEEALNEQKAVYHRLKTRRSREAAYLKRLEEELEREEQERALREAERLLSELQNPSKYGWYYGDGYYETADKLFGMREDLLEVFQDQQDTWRDKWLQKHPETFTEKFKRHFWPPSLFCKGKCRLFRTRGTYLDFPEVIADQPRQIDVNFEREEQAFLSNTLFRGSEVDENAITMADLLTEDAEAEEEKKKSLKKAGGGDIKGKNLYKTKNAKINTGWDQWYYDDDAGEFFPKKEGFSGEYYMDGPNMCWRHKRPPRLNFKRQPTPYDWYYDADAGQVIARADYLGFDEFEYDAPLGVYKVKPMKYSRELRKLKKKSYAFGIFSNKKEVKPSDGAEDLPPPVKRPLSDFYFDEKFGKWLLKDNPNPNPLAANPSVLSLESLEADTGEPGNDAPPDIAWDENGHRYTRKWEGEWRGLTGLGPDDYYFEDETGLFYPKPARQGKAFKYHPFDGVWRRAKAPAPNKLKVLSKTVNTPSDYFFDSFQGQFLNKNKDKGAMYDYWLQKFARIWRKHQEPKSGMYPEDFYWDVNKKLWLPKAVRMEMIRNAQSLKNRWATEITGGFFKPAPSTDTPDSFYWDTEEGQFVHKSKTSNYYLDTDGFWKCEALRNRLMDRTFPHDFYYDNVHKEFRRKNRGEPYIFNSTKNVWTGPSCPKEFVLNFYFDVESEKWVSGEYGKVGTLTQGFPVESHPNHFFRIPDDYWFDEDYGRFEIKHLEDMPRYFFNASEGAWKKKGNLGPNTANLHPRNFFFDDATGKFKLKTLNRPTDYWYDNNNKIFRHVFAIGETRSGCQPTDFHWNSDLKNYVRLPVDKNRGKAISQRLDWDPMRRYSKGWLEKHPSQEAMTQPPATEAAPPPPAAQATPPPNLKGSVAKPPTEQNVAKKTTFAPQSQKK